jgi:flagellar biosynthetic protein FlhB
MAEGDDATSKTEEPTPRRLEEARQRGDVAKSADFAQAAALAGTLSVLAITGTWMARNLVANLRPFLEHPDAFPLEGAGGANVARYAVLAAAPILVVVMAATALSGAAGNLIQTGLLFTTDKLQPKLDKISPMAGFQRLFGVDGLMHFLRAVLKIGLTGAVAWFVLRPHMHELAGLSALSPTAILPFAMTLLRPLAFAVLALLAAIGALDWLWQRQRFMDRMRMSKEELKEEFRQSEGDPHVKARQRQIRNERSRRRMMQAVPKATVVIMNPTHYAVALRYEAGETDAPECVAKGMDDLALKIREVAEEAGVPVVEDAPLARALYATVDIDETIPTEHFEAVAKVIGFVLNSSRAPKRASQL